MNKNNAFNEMMVHLPLCTHKEASKVLVIAEENKELEEQTKKHSKTTNFEFGNLASLNSKDDKILDVIILTEDKIDEMLFAKIDRVLKNDGLIVFPTKAFSKDKEKLKQDLLLAGNKFWICMPFKFGHHTSIIASKKYHPTADINLQRADLLDDLDYYSAEIHTASFVFPASEHKELTGIAKR